ncbi:MAG TPA: HEPN domain-containing protein [Candidatus Nanoarchaeia archaeon]|nr:HEPN domain-containing protein [Candidatus Nanoarchaeia archaeon]
MNLNDCFQQGLLKKEQPDKLKAQKSIEIAVHKLSLAKKLLNVKIYEETVTSSYACMFHAARALLFRDGIREKSHYALFLYIKEKYDGKIEKRFINELNALRLQRHEISYGLEKLSISHEEAASLIALSEEFLTVAQRLLKA